MAVDEDMICASDFRDFITISPREWDSIVRWFKMHDMELIRQKASWDGTDRLFMTFEQARMFWSYCRAIESLNGTAKSELLKILGPFVSDPRSLGYSVNEARWWTSVLTP